MKYKNLALDKVERLANQMKNLEFALNRNDVSSARDIMVIINDRVEDLRSQISIEQD